MKNINRRLGNIEKKLCIDKEETVVFPYTDENGIEHKIEMTFEEWANIIKNIPPTKGMLPCQEKEYQERPKNDKIQQKPTK